MSEDRDRKYGEMTVEELEQRLRETFFYTDKIDDTVYLQLERLRTALEMKQPAAFDQTAEEFWERFRQEHGEEIDRVCAAAGNNAVPQSRRRRGVLRSVLIAAVLVVLLAGAALAADSLGLWAWVPRWNAAAGRYEPAAMEVSGEGPILAALAELGITEPVYPAKLPEGFVITESHISEDPLVMVEQYARGNERLSITVTPVKGVKTAIYQKSGMPPQEYKSGKGVSYIFGNEGTITVVWNTRHYATTISGDIPMDEIKAIIESLHDQSKGANPK